MIAFATVGIAIAYWVDFGTVLAKGLLVWRFPVAFQVIFSILRVGLIWNLPDIPRLYYAKGMTEEGDAVLARLHGKDIADPVVEIAKSEISASIELEMRWKNSELRTSFGTLRTLKLRVECAPA
jgi:hypothetical protein